MAGPYAYPTSNSQLIRKLEKHPEGGYFLQTVSLESYIPTIPSTTLRSAALEGREQSAWGPGATILGGEATSDTSERKVDATAIYYLLCPQSSQGKMHMNLHSHFHLLHQGRALYTLIKPPSACEEPTVYRIILGHNTAAGEVPQLFVPGGWWKASEIPEEDLLLLDAPETAEMKEQIGCLISEIVVPGWNPDQHQFISEEKLKSMWGGKSGWEPYTRYLGVGNAPDI